MKKIKIRKYQLELMLEKMKEIAEQEQTTPVTMQEVIDRWKNSEVDDNDYVFEFEDINLDELN